MDFQNFKRRCVEVSRILGVQDTLVYPIGTPKANVWLVTLQPGQDINKTQPPMLTNLLAQSGAARMTYLTTVYKSCAPTQLGKPEWLKLFHEEVTLLKPRAVILLGHEVARAVLGVKDPTYTKLRYSRFYFEDQLDTSYFVTYSPEEVQDLGGEFSLAYMHWTQDIINVFEVVPAYFRNIKKLKR